MQIDVKVVAQAKRNDLKKHGDLYKVYLTAPAVEGKANKALVALLADHFKVKQNQISIIKGLKSKSKTINIKT